MEYIGILIIAALAVIIYLLLRPKQKDEELNLIQQQALTLLQQQQQQTQTLLQQQQQHTQQLMQQQIESLREHIRLSLEGNTKLISQRLDNSAQLMSNVRSQLSQVEEAHKRIYDVAKDISELQKILQAPKLRGKLGELFLKDLLCQILPPQHFKLPHTFKSGERVDAVINLGNAMVPIDAKFPLENFRRLMQFEKPEQKQAARKKFLNDVKKHINAIASKYILPDEGTYDFALMYIPAENVYYEIIIRDEEDKNILSHALECKVIPVSPNTLYAYLQAILLGLKGLKVERHVEEILQSLSRLRNDFARFQIDFNKLGTHLSHARSSYDLSEKRLNKFGEKLEVLDTIKEDSVTIGHSTKVIA